jgi:hypothetical protein
MMRGLSKQWMLVILQAITLSAALPAHGQAPPELKGFDNLITRELVTAGFKRPIRFSFKTFEHEKTRIYESAYQLKQKRSGDHYICLIGVAPSGVLLDPEEYDRRRAEVEQEAASRSGEYLSEELPSIGKRAMRQFFGFGPGGAAYGLTFTTSDGKFDVRITISNLLSNGVKDPGFDVLKTARQISLRYDRKFD